MVNSLLQAAPSSRTIRAELERTVVADLLGPAGGPEEEIVERTVRDRYLVGVLAPRRRKDEPVPEVEAPPPPTAGPVDEDDFPPVINDELAEEGNDWPEDGPADLSVALPKATEPSSFGLTFCVDGSAREFQVTASWGQYLRPQKEERIDPATGRALRLWKRHARGGSPHRIPLRLGAMRPIVADPLCPEVTIQWIVRRCDPCWIVTLFLVNGQEESKPKDHSWLFQPQLVIEASDGSPIFIKKTTRRLSEKLDSVFRAEEEAMAMLYRHHVEFAIGHGVSVHAETAPGRPDRAVRIMTQVIPAYEVPRTTAATADDADVDPAFASLAGLCRDMKELAETQSSELAARLGPLTTAYGAWIDSQEARIGDPASGLAEHRVAATLAVARCREALARIEAGIELLATDSRAAEAFRFMNRAMWLQRTRTILAESIRRDLEWDFDRDIDRPENRSWHPFQLAFILLNLPGITRLDHPERSDSHQALADLLWFPTGGGKTEAYLGLTAYTLGLRRLQGPIEGRSGEDGVAVLMRYTLRLLTIQQFQRAAALICACESIRREALARGDARWGQTPFRIGLWVGRKTTPNTTEQSAEAVKLDLGGGRRGGTGGGGSPYQLTFCPWCGSPIGKDDLRVETVAAGHGRTLIYCGDDLGRCLFTRRQAEDEGLPVVVVDEEIYRRLPSLLIATVDKFAQMPWNGAVQMLFGQVDAHCDRHGYHSPEIKDSDHPRKGQLPSTRLIQHNLLRPPDLIIQDELHLISGPLGTLVGLYETAIDSLCTWEVGGRKVRPKVIASTATIRNAGDQVFKLFLRRVNVFPPHGLDIRDNFFSLQREPSEGHPGRRYIGICAPGRRLKAALIRVYVAFLSASQVLFEKYEQDADAWMTLVGYFNSMRELGGMRRLVDDDVRNRLGKMDRRGLANRAFPIEYLQELTSRMGSTQIPLILDRLEAPFDPVKRAKRREMAKAKRYEEMPQKPIDVLLATNMISVGVDVKRLGLMVVAGQPKTTAEYIQATSRVGRSRPGIVCTVFNWARPRDLSHYESFEHYHATFYKHVEALSVTPFSPGSLSRGLAALLVSCIRLRGTEFNPNGAAMRLATEAGHPMVSEAIRTIVERAHQVGDDAEVRDFVAAELRRKVDYWQRQAQRTAGGQKLGYEEASDGLTKNLLHRPGLEHWDEFTCLNSLREVEPTVNLVLDDHHLGGGPDEVPPAEDEPDAQAAEAPAS
jgi:hypothetical protein